MTDESEVNKDYRLQAKAYWDLNSERLKFVTQVQAEYGKWLVVTITSAHLAAIYLVSKLETPEIIRRDPASYWPFIIGICTILACGLSLWANYSIAMNTYDSWMQPGMLTDSKYWPKESSKLRKKITLAFFYIPLVLGLVSACCIPWGGYRVFYYPHSPLKTETFVPANAGAPANHGTKTVPK